MGFLHYVVSSTPPALAHVLTVTAHAWGLSDQPRVALVKSTEVSIVQL
jgi:hypothetical protein